MKTWPLLLALTVPTVAVATIAMEPTGAQAPDGKAQGHRQLFTVKYVLRPNQAPLPHVVIEQGDGLVPPIGTAGRQALLLGAGYRDPNAILCYGWGCEGSRHAWSR